MLCWNERHSDNALYFIELYYSLYLHWIDQFSNICYSSAALVCRWIQHLLCWKLDRVAALASSEGNHWHLEKCKRKTIAKEKLTKRKLFLSPPPPLCNSTLGLWQHFQLAGLLQSRSHFISEQLRQFLRRTDIEDGIG